MINLLNCDHKCCKDCTSKHFTIIIKDKNISEATCPFCLEPKNLAEDDDKAANYFAKLDVLLKPLIDCTKDPQRPLAASAAQSRGL